MNIYIMGASGSGTSTIGKILSKRINIRQYDSDDFFWMKTNIPFSVKRPVNERIDLLDELISNESDWIISGTALNWGNAILKHADFIFWLNCPTEIRINRLKEREKKRFGNRIKSGGDMYYNHQAFIRWAEKYDSGDLNMRCYKSEKVWLKPYMHKTTVIENADSESSANIILEIIGLDIQFDSHNL